MAVTAWVAEHTGLPSFHVTADERIVVGDRVLRAPGGPVLLSDALAHPGTATVYSVGGVEISLTRRDDGHALLDITSRRRVPLVWLGDDSDAWDPRLSMFQPSGRRSPLPRWSLRAATPSGTLAARTMGEATHVLRGLLTGDRRTPLIALHSPRACQIPGCDIDPVRVVLVGASSSIRQGRVDVATRSWSIPYQGIDPTEGRYTGATPVVTWGEYASLGAGWQAKSALDLAHEIGGMPS